MTTRATVLCSVLAGVALGGCTEGGTDQSRLPLERRVAERYANVLGVELSEMQRRPTGLYVRDVVEGEGMRADSGDIVVVHYTGWLPTGKEFDSSRGGDPLEVALGYGRVIQGWDQGVVGMRVGGQRRLVVPPVMGYGARGSGPIPGNSTLVFDVELVDVVDRTGNGGARADTASEGTPSGG